MARHDPGGGLVPACEDCATGTRNSDGSTIHTAWRKCPCDCHAIMAQLASIHTKASSAASATARAKEA